MAERDQGTTKVAETKWELRIRRADLLARDPHCATALLRFYAHLAGAQRAIYQAVQVTPSQGAFLAQAKAACSDSALAPAFRQLLAVVQANGPDPLAQRAAALLGVPEPSAIVEAFGDDRRDALERFFARAILQPVAERFADATQTPLGYEAAVCPLCESWPVLAVLRPENLGAKRSLLCSLCSAEWPFPRVQCIACGETASDLLSVYASDEFEHVRMDACETCKTCLKAIDLSKNGNAVPVVDDIASLPLSLWADEHGYTRLAKNILDL